MNRFELDFIVSPTNKFVGYMVMKWVLVKN